MTVTVAKFREDCSGALSFVMDDGDQSQEAAVAMFDKLGIKASFALAPHWIDIGYLPAYPSVKTANWDFWKKVVAHGHEIMSHSKTHPWLARLNDQQLQAELAGSKAELEEKTGTTVITFACPYDNYDGRVEKAILQHYLEFRRTTRVLYGNESGCLSRAEHMNRIADDAVAKRSWAVAEMHGIDDVAWGPTDSKELQNHLAHVKSLIENGKLWVDTFGNVARYEKERDAVELKIVSIGEKHVKFTAASNLDPKLYDVPLTFKISTGAAKIESAAARREGSDDQQKVTVKNGAVVLFDAAPGPEVITVEWK